MPKREKFLHWLKATKIFSLGLFLTIGGIAKAQSPEVIMLSRKVGTVLDAEEKEILGLFPQIDGFESAQFYDLGGGRFRVKIVIVDHTRTRSISRDITWPQFFGMKRIADAHPLITEEMRREHREKLAYLRVEQTVELIPPSTYCSIRHISGRKVTGRFVSYDDGTINFQSPTRRFHFPISELESISYRPFIDDGNPVKKALSFALGGAVGLAFGELWNKQSRPVNDITWNNRFSGIVLGLISGSELFQAVTVLTSPKRFISFTPA